MYSIHSLTHCDALYPAQIYIHNIPATQTSHFELSWKTFYSYGYRNSHLYYILADIYLTMYV